MSQKIGRKILDNRTTYWGILILILPCHKWNPPILKFSNIDRDPVANKPTIKKASGEAETVELDGETVCWDLSN